MVLLSRLLLFDVHLVFQVEVGRFRHVFKLTSSHVLEVRRPVSSARGESGEGHICTASRAAPLARHRVLVLPDGLTCSWLVSVGQGTEIAPDEVAHS
jgi:hypothetical protein